MGAYYNEIDEFAADWLENLIAANLIAPGDVDRRSIADVQPDDLKGYTQCHFFAGIGIWSYGLRLAGWPDDRPVWTGSCPCPPFSAAGKAKACPGCGGYGPIPHVARTGVFVCCHCGNEWRADERHLWPEFGRLIWERRPSVVLGEQVASADGRVWVDLVCSSLEIMDYASVSIDTSSAVYGAPQIRQRIRFSAQNMRPSTVRMDDPNGARHFGKVSDSEATSRDEARVRLSDSGCSDGWVAHPDGSGWEAWLGHDTPAGHGSPAPPARGSGRVAESDDTGLQGRRGAVGGELREVGQTAARGAVGGEGVRLEEAEGPSGGRVADDVGGAGSDSGLLRGPGHSSGGPAPTYGPWGDADWLLCRDGKWRPVESGTFPLAHGDTSRVGRLRAYGNAVEAQATRHFIEGVMESML